VIQIGYLPNTRYWSACQIGRTVSMTGSCRPLRFTYVWLLLYFLYVARPSVSPSVCGSKRWLRCERQPYDFHAYESVYAWKIFKLIRFISCSHPARPPFLYHVVKLAYGAVALNSIGCSSPCLLLCPLPLRYVCWGAEILVPRRLVNCGIKFWQKWRAPQCEKLCYVHRWQLEEYKHAFHL